MNTPQTTKTSGRNADRAPQHATGEEQREPAHEQGHDAPRLRTRQRRSAIQDDPYHIPKDEIPEGSSYEWKRYSVSGQSADSDPFYLSQMRSQGWEPVDPKRHPNWVPPGYDKPHIIKGGLILMERPIELTNEARAEQRQLARQQMTEAQQRLGMTPKDTMTRQFPGAEPRIVHEVGRMVAIEE